MPTFACLRSSTYYILLYLNVRFCKVSSRNYSDSRQTEFVFDADLNLIYIPLPNVFKMTRSALIDYLSGARRKWLEVAVLALFDEWRRLLMDED